MRLNISKSNNTYNQNYYKIDIQVDQTLTKEEYDKIIVAIEKIAEVVDPIIRLEKTLKKDKKDEQN